MKNDPKRATVNHTLLQNRKNDPKTNKKWNMGFFGRMAVLQLRWDLPLAQFEGNR
jgi:hypothetical protein